MKEKRTHQPVSGSRAHARREAGRELTRELPLPDFVVRMLGSRRARRLILEEAPHHCCE